MNTNVLVVTTMEDAESCARTLAEQLGLRVEIAQTRKAALLALRRHAFALVVVEESLAEGDCAWAEQIWKMCGLALPLQLHLTLAGTARLTREVKAALARRDAEQALARMALAHKMEDDLKSSVTGIALGCELALLEPALPPSLELKLRHLAELASHLRERLRRAADAHQPHVPHPVSRIA